MLLIIDNSGQTVNFYPRNALLVQ